MDNSLLLQSLEQYIGGMRLKNIYERLLDSEELTTALTDPEFDIAKGAFSHRFHNIFCRVRAEVENDLGECMASIGASKEGIFNCLSGALSAAKQQRVSAVNILKCLLITQDFRSFALLCKEYFDTQKAVLARGEKRTQSKAHNATYAIQRRPSAKNRIALPLHWRNQVEAAQSLLASHEAGKLSTEDQVTMLKWARLVVDVEFGSSDEENAERARQLLAIARERINVDLRVMVLMIEDIDTRNHVGKNMDELFAENQKLEVAISEHMSV